MREHRYHLTRLSKNMKLGGIPVTTTSRDTCPDNCNLKGNGCYADQFPLSLHWNKLSEGSRGYGLDQLCAEIKALPKYTLWRWAQAGDLPGDGTTIDQVGIRKLVAANKGRLGFGYTHYDPTIFENTWRINFANTNGFTLNMSAETLQQADEYAELGIGPVVVILPHDQTEDLLTPAGRRVAVCPASKEGSDMTCAQCAICANAERKSIIGFPAHGGGKAKVTKVFFAELEAA
jgi:hypothetical protein